MGRKRFIKFYKFPLTNCSKTELHITKKYVMYMYKCNDRERAPLHYTDVVTLFLCKIKYPLSHVKSVTKYWLPP